MMKILMLVVVAACFVAMVNAQSPLAALSGLGSGSSGLMTMAALQSKCHLYTYFLTFFYLFWSTTLLLCSAYLHWVPLPFELLLSDLKAN